MRLTRAALMLGAALLPLSTVAQPAMAGPAAPQADAGAVKPIGFTERTLDNGLKVYAIRDTTTSNVSVQVWYDVGSKNDPKGRSGFAHMFEHLMFKGSRNLKAESLDRLTEDVGGYNNASTDDDYTDYFEVVPANNLERLLFAEADRMASLVVNKDKFESERDVVKEELRSRVLAQPYGKLFYLYFPEISYSKSPYGRPGIGSIADLDSATVQDIRAFHATYYRPDNATLVVAGNFDPDQLDKWVDKYFAPIKKPDHPIPRANTTEPLRSKPTHQTVYEKNTPLPAVLISYPLPPDNDPDIPALSVLNTILAGGKSSRLYHSLVYSDQIARAAQTQFSSKKGQGALGVYAILAAGKTADQGEAALREQIAKLRDAPVTDAELAEAKNEIVTNTIESRQTAVGKARTLASSVLVDDDPRAADKQLAAIQGVTAADVQRVARKYLAKKRSAALHYLPERAKPEGVTGDTVSVPSTISVKPLEAPENIRIVKAASDAERVKPPKAGPAIDIALPKPQQATLANGMKVVIVEKHDLPLVTASVQVSGGGVLDPEGKAGTASLAGSLMTKGTDSHSASEIANIVESLGGSINSGASWDGSGVTLTVKSDQLDPALGILADVARNPAFSKDELDRLRAQTIDGLSVQMKQPGALAGMVANRAVYGSSPYGHVLSGTPGSLKAITRGDVVKAYGESWQPDRATLVLVGDITQAEGLALAKEDFGSWTQSAAATAPAQNDAAETSDALDSRVIVVDLPGAGQAGVTIARKGIARSDPSYYPASVANSVLGVGFSSWLNQEIRVKRGLAYGAGSSVDARNHAGPIAASTQTKNPSAPQVVSVMLDQMKRLGSETIAPDELGPRKAVLIGGFGRSAETTSGISGLIDSYVVKHVPLDELQKVIGNIEAVQPDQVKKAGAKLFDPDSATIVVVGDAKQFVDELRKTYPDLKLIEASDLDLDSALLSQKGE